MTKKDYFKTHDKAVAYYSGLGGVEIYGFNYDINDSVFYKTGCWCGEPVQHKSRIYYTIKGDAYFICHGYRIPLADCLRI